MTAGNQIPEGIVTPVDDGRDVVHGQSVGAFPARLTVRFEVCTILANAMRGINHGLALRWCNIIAYGTTDACTSSGTGFVDGCRVVGFVDLVAFFVVVRIACDLFQTMLFHVGT